MMFSCCRFFREKFNGSLSQTTLAKDPGTGL
jgi:hypothetical protein